jgi:hypothetical protein
LTLEMSEDYGGAVFGTRLAEIQETPEAATAYVNSVPPRAGASRASSCYLA